MGFQQFTLSSQASQTRGLATHRLVPIVLFFVAFAAMVPQFSKGSLGEGYEAVAVARNLADHGEFANPFRFPTGTTAHLPPLYPAFLSLLIRCFGYSAQFAMAAFLCGILVQALHAALLPLISGLLFDDRTPGIYAAVLAAVLPLYYFLPQWESIYCAAALMLFLLASDRLFRRGGTLRGVAAGLLFGLLALLNPACVLVAAPWLVFRVRGQHAAAFMRTLALVGFGALLAIAPWTLRNYREFHAIFFVRDNFGLELYVSNNDLAAPTIGLNKRGVLQAKHPNNSFEEAKTLSSAGEVRYHKQRMADALDWIRDHPSRFLSLTLARVRLFWFPDNEGDMPWHGVAVSFVSIAALVGMGLLVVNRRPLALFFAAEFTVYPLLYYFVQVDVRYRTPLLWLSLLTAGYALSRIVSAISHTFRPRGREILSVRQTLWPSS